MLPFHYLFTTLLITSVTAEESSITVFSFFSSVFSASFSTTGIVVLVFSVGFSVSVLGVVGLFGVVFSDVLVGLLSGFSFSTIVFVFGFSFASSSSVILLSFPVSFSSFE